MKTAIMQPYFFPYIGYWQLIRAADVFVIYDDVNYIKQGWINRNRILINGREHFLTLPLSKSGSFKQILEIEIAGGKEKLVKTVEQAYKKAAHFSQAFPVIHDILSDTTENLAEYLIQAIRKMARYLNLSAELIVSSQIEKTPGLKGKERVLDICKRLNTSTYVNAPGGRDLYSTDDFGPYGMQLRFLETQFSTYPQNAESFIPGLSIIDVMMNNPYERIQGMLHDFKLA